MGNTLKLLYSGTCVSLLLYACHSGEQKQAARAETGQEKTDTVAVYIAQIDSVEKTVILPGELLPHELVEIRSKVQGYLRKINVDIGSPVRRGQLLALIDAPEIYSRAGEVNEKVHSARAKYQASKDNYERIHAASQTDGVIASSELEKVKNIFFADSADYKAAVFSAASYKQIGNYLTIRAPFNGVVTKRNAHEGTFVGTPGELPMLEIEDNSRLRLRVSVPEVYAGTLLKSPTIKFTTKALPERVFEAILVRKSERIDNATRSEIWEFEVANREKLLKSGMYADARLALRRTAPVVTLPPSAIVTSLERKFVIRIKQGKTEWIDVNQGLNLGDKIEVFGGISAGDTLALKANEELKPDIAVKVKILKH